MAERADGGAGQALLVVALVELDAGLDATGAEELDEVLSTSGSLVDSLLVHDDTTDVLLDSWSGEKKLAVGTSVGLSVLDADGIEALADGASRLVGSENTLAGGADLLCGLDELFLEFSRCVQHNNY